MQHLNVCLESLGYCLPSEVISSSEIERRLAPLYERLRLPEGRLELMTGIRQRRVWPAGTLPGSVSVQSAERAIRAARIERDQIGMLIHASVCRDHLEPATACRVHHELGLRPDCIIYDVSNACLGLMNGALQIATAIELGQIRAGIVVGTESSRQLMETTIRALNQDQSLTRNQIKLAVASLTIGSGSCAMLLTDRELSQTDNRLLATSVRANTACHQLCHSGQDEAGDGMQPLMQTDSEQLMQEGIATGVETFQDFLRNAEWSVDSIDKSVCHQVGAAHRKLMLESLGLDPARDFATLDWLGNTGSVALPTALAMAAKTGFIEPNDHLALLGIGSGINCVMMALTWQQSLVEGDLGPTTRSTEELQQSSALIR